MILSVREALLYRTEALAMAAALAVLIIIPIARQMRRISLKAKQWIMKIDFERSQQKASLKLKLKSN